MYHLKQKSRDKSDLTSLRKVKVENSQKKFLGREGMKTEIQMGVLPFINTLTKCLCYEKQGTLGGK